tara:strand:- start:293 stop:532 length:240 start_codon:yes stop_codon:yes gene_type:complete
MRTSKNKNNYNCKVYDFEGTCIHDKDYIKLPDIAEDLKVSKDVVYNISSRPGNYNSQYKTFKYQPKINIVKIVDLDNEP